MILSRFMGGFIMKKWMVTLCVAAMLTGLIACGNKDENSGESTGSESIENSVESSTDHSTAQESEVDEESATDGADGDNGGWSEEMTALLDAVKEELGDDYWPNEAIPAEALESLYGISPDLYDGYVGELPMISTNVDTLLIIKAKSDKVEEVVELLNAYHDRQVNDAMQYPQNIGKVQAARVEQIGDYVCFVRLGGSAVDVEDSDEKIRLCQEQNDLALEIISQNIEHE